MVEVYKITCAVVMMLKAYSLKECGFNPHSDVEEVYSVNALAKYKASSIVQVSS